MVFIFNSVSFASCDFSKDVTQNEDGSYRYSKGCHQEVGRLSNKSYLLGERVKELELQNGLKDIMINKYEERTQLWMQTSVNLNDKLQSYERFSSSDRWISFGLGVAVTALSVYAASQLVK